MLFRSISAPDTVADNVSTSRTFSVTVNPVNDKPSVGPTPASISIPESSPIQTINLTGVDAGPFETQAMKIEVVSSDTSLIPNPTVTFTPPTPGVAGSGSAVIKYQPTAFQFGSATLQVKITDAGLDGLLGTNTDNGVTIKNIPIVVTRVNDAPTINAVSPVNINEESGQKTVALSGITAGGGETQILRDRKSTRLNSSHRT